MTETKPQRLTASVRVDLIKPLNAEWSDIGKRLSDLRDIGHRLVNAALRGCAVAKMTGEEKGLTRHARAALDEQFISYKDWNAAMATRGNPEQREAFARRAGLAPTGTMIDSWRQRATQMFIGKTKEMARGEASLPTVRKGTPIPFRDGSWELRDGDKGYVLALALLPQRGHRVEFAIGVDGGGAHAHIRRMLSGDPDVKLGDVKVLRDERKNKWFAQISYSWPRPENPCDPMRLLVVRRGMASILTAASTDGWFGRFEPGGGGLLDAKRKFDARRRSVQQHMRGVGPGARGHGEARRLEAITKLDRAERNYVKTFCQQIGAWVAKSAVARGCGTVCIEAFGSPVDPTEETWWLLKRWPWAELKAAIAWACRKAGLDLRDVDAAVNLRRCPNDKCGHVHETAQTGRFLCAACGYERPADFVATMNMLATAGAPAAVKTIDTKVKKARRDARRGSQEAAE